MKIREDMRGLQANVLLIEVLRGWGVFLRDVGK